MIIHAVTTCYFGKRDKITIVNICSCVFSGMEIEAQCLTISIIYTQKVTARFGIVLGRQRQEDPGFNASLG